MGGGGSLRRTAAMMKRLETRRTKVVSRGSGVDTILKDILHTYSLRLLDYSVALDS